jgi:signal recognition particle subunit SRP54
MSSVPEGLAMAHGEFTLEDFRRQMRQIRKLGAIGEIMKMIPGLSGLARRLADVDLDRDLRQIEAIIDSMTPAERRDPALIEPSRCRRVALGSGSQPDTVNHLLKDFQAMKQVMDKFAGMGPLERRRARRRIEDDLTDENGFDAFELN